MVNENTIVNMNPMDSTFISEMNVTQYIDNIAHYYLEDNFCDKIVIEEYTVS